MSYRIAFLPEAEQDIDIIEEYLSQFYASTVRSFFATLRDQVERLKTMPYSCQAFEEDPFFRRMVVGDYLLFYSVDEKRQLVAIHHIWHGKRDVSKLMAEHRTGL